MSRFRKLLSFTPVFIAFLMCDKTWSSFAAMMVGGLIVWIPFWLAWWLSDGFSIFNTPSIYEYKYGQFGPGYYSDDRFIHR